MKNYLILYLLITFCYSQNPIDSRLFLETEDCDSTFFKITRSISAFDVNSYKLSDYFNEDFSNCFLDKEQEEYFYRFNALMKIENGDFSIDEFVFYMVQKRRSFEYLQSELIKVDSLRNKYNEITKDDIQFFKLSKKYSDKLLLINTYKDYEKLLLYLFSENNYAYERLFYQMNSDGRMLALWKSNYRPIEDSYIFGTLYEDPKIIHGLAFDFTFFQEYDYYQVNGLKLSLNPLPILGLAVALPYLPSAFLKPYFTIEKKNDSTKNDNHYYNEIIKGEVNGININFVELGNSNHNGVSISLLAQIHNYMNGLSLSTFRNYSIYMKGLQLSASNYARNAVGIQIGLFNRADKLKGIQIGLWNVTDKFSFPLINIGL